MYHFLKEAKWNTSVIDFKDLESIQGREQKYDLIIGLGKKVLKYYRPKDKFDHIRGSVLKDGKTNFIFTYAPEELKKPTLMFKESSIENSLIFASDIDKAKDVFDNGWTVPEERFILNPTLEDLRKFTEFVEREKPLLGTDIEATGLNIELAQVVVIGFAHSESDCFVLPFTKEHGHRYWSPDDERIVRQYLTRIFKAGRFMFQNGVGYDVPLLMQQGYNFELENYTDETMFLHHVISPELPHNIGFISSIYGKMPLTVAA